MHWTSTLEKVLRDLSRENNSLDGKRLREISQIVQGAQQATDANIQTNIALDTLRTEVRHLEQTLRNEGILISQYRVTPDTPLADGDPRGR